MLARDGEKLSAGRTDRQQGSPLEQGVSVSRTAHLLILWLISCTIGRLDYTLRVQPRATEMTQWVKVLAIKPDNLNEIPGTHSLDRKNWLIRVVNSWTHALTETLRHTHTHTPQISEFMPWLTWESLYPKQYHIYAWFISEKPAASLPPIVDWCQPVM